MTTFKWWGSSWISNSDGIGEKVLKFLNDLFVNGKTIRDYGHDSLGGKSEDIPLPTNETVYNAENNIQQ